MRHCSQQRGTDACEATVQTVSSHYHSHYYSLLEFKSKNKKTVFNPSSSFTSPEPSVEDVFPTFLAQSSAVHCWL